MKLLLFFFFLCIILSSFSLDIEEKEVWNTVRTINRHWAITENMDSLSLFIHNDMVLISPAGKQEGKENIIASYTNYVQAAETISIIERDPDIRIYKYNQTAVVTYYVDLKTKTIDGKEQTFTCLDMYTLIKVNGKWIAAAQYYSFSS